MFRAARAFAGAYYSDLWLYPSASKAEAGERLFRLIARRHRAGTSGAALSKYVAPVFWCPKHERLWFEMYVADEARYIHPRRVPKDLWGGIEAREVGHLSPSNVYNDDQSKARVTVEDMGQWQAEIGCALLNARERVAFDPAHARANDSAARRIAQGILASGDPAAMPILADALEEAGCATAAILDHCRQEGAHHPGCWVVGLVLGK